MDSLFRNDQSITPINSVTICSPSKESIRPYEDSTRPQQLYDLPQEKLGDLLNIINDTIEASADCSALDTIIGKQIDIQNQHLITQGIDVGAELTKKLIFECPGSQLDQ